MSLMKHKGEKINPVKIDDWKRSEAKKGTGKAGKKKFDDNKARDKFRAANEAELQRIMKEDHENNVKLDRKIGWITGKKPK